MTASRSKKLLVKACKSKHANAPQSRGKIEYPSTHTLWKKLMRPPRSCAFSVTMAAPAQTTTNTAAKTNARCDSGAPADNAIDNVKHTASGPHRSHSLSRSSTPCCDARGSSTNFSFAPTSLKSLRIVSETGSSSVVSTGDQSSMPAICFYCRGGVPRGCKCVWEVGAFLWPGAGKVAAHKRSGAKKRQLYPRLDSGQRA